MPVIEGTHDYHVPPLMRMPQVVEFSRKEPFGNLGYVNQKGSSAYEIHAYHPG